MSVRHVRAFIAGCSGKALTSDEKKFFKDVEPWGLIVFARNCESPQQLKALSDEFRACVGRSDAPVIVDQEGGRVQRLSPSTGPWRKYPAPALYEAFYRENPLYALRVIRNIGRLMAQDLEDAGISVNCVPVLDIPQKDTHAIVGDRAYSSTPETALVLARAHVAGFIQGGIMPVMKHAPGHGRATVDSHHELPRVDASRAALELIDFRTFAAFADCPMAMTAHVVFSAIDDKAPATLSRIVIRNLLRKQMGYNGLLMTDDLSMKALSGSYKEKIEAALYAGCDIALHCNGHMDEMQEVAEAAGPLGGKSMARAKAALRTQQKPLPYDEKEAMADYEALMGFSARMAA
jgi:beta-N-acetylhexosaminidase